MPLHTIPGGIVSDINETEVITMGIVDHYINNYSQRQKYFVVDYNPPGGSHGFGKEICRFATRIRREQTSK